VSVFIALGPVMQLTHCKSSLIHFISDFRPLIINTAAALGFYEFFPANYLTTGSMRIICGTIPQLCNFGLYLLSDEDPSVNDPDRTPVYLGHSPAGTSLRAINHFAQIFDSKKFQRMDYGSSDNRRVYGQNTPPEINLQNIQSVPIGLFVGNFDQLATVDDNRWAKTQLKTLKFYKEYNLGHLGFMIGKDMTYFSVDAMNMLKTYHPAKVAEEEPTFLE
jgi:lysosomal acid lipase/cholesteryl ester hydrolase